MKRLLLGLMLLISGAAFAADLMPVNLTQLEAQLLPTKGYTWLLSMSLEQKLAARELLSTAIAADIDAISAPAVLDYDTAATMASIRRIAPDVVVYSDVVNRLPEVIHNLKRGADQAFFEDLSDSAVRRKGGWGWYLHDMLTVDHNLDLLQEGNKRNKIRADNRNALASIIKPLYQGLVSNGDIKNVVVVEYLLNALLNHKSGNYSYSNLSNMSFNDKQEELLRVISTYYTNLLNLYNKTDANDAAISEAQGAVEFRRLEIQQNTDRVARALASGWDVLSERAAPYVDAAGNLVSAQATKVATAAGPYWDPTVAAIAPYIERGQALAQQGIQAARPHVVHGLDVMADTAASADSRAREYVHAGVQRGRQMARNADAAVRDTVRKASRSAKRRLGYKVDEPVSVIPDVGPLYQLPTESGAEYFARVTGGATQGFVAEAAAPAPQSVEVLAANEEIPEPFDIF